MSLSGVTVVVSCHLFCAVSEFGRRAEVRQEDHQQRQNFRRKMMVEVKVCTEPLT